MFSRSARLAVPSRPTAATAAPGPRRPARFFSSSPPRCRLQPPFSSLPPPTTTGFSLTTLLTTSILASTLTYFALNGASPILLDVFSMEPEPPFKSKRFGSTRDFELAIEELKEAFGKEQCSTDPEELLGHGFSPNTYHAPRVPAVVVYVESTEDVVRVMKTATKYRVPVVPWSGGTSLEGHITAPFGGISVDLSRMDKILKINVSDSDVVVQSGVGWEQLNEHLKDEGIPLFFPLDPGSGATIGGMVATGCSGTNAVRYGTAKAEWFLNITVVLPSGEVIKTRSRARKSSAGFDVTKVFIGAEGTLGIVTEATLRLAPLLPTMVAVCSFPDVKHATEAVYEVLGTGVPLQCVELLDTTMMRALNGAAMTDQRYAEKDSIFFKFQGTPGIIAEASSVVANIVPKHGGEDFRVAKDQEESQEMWRGRKMAHWSVMALRPEAKNWSTDVCIPVSHLPDLVKTTQDDLKECGLTAAVLGHVGDGNFHAGILFETPEEYEVADGAVHRMVERAIALGGTCTGEHGVGVGKKEYLVSELGQGTVDVMKLIKNSIDPLGIMNPGKLYPDDLPNEHVVPSWSPAITK